MTIFNSLNYRLFRSRVYIIAQLNKTAIVVAGPTATGKTDLAVALATHFNTAIISADSRQCYRELEIGVAKPSKESLRAVTHYFINSHSIHQPVDVAGYELYALEKLGLIFSQNNVAVIAGGTGLYIKAICEGLDHMPAIPAAIRAEIRDQYHRNGLEWLKEEVKQHDPLFLAGGEMQNPHRMMRALEFVKTTGQSIRAFQRGEREPRPFGIIKVGLALPKEELVERINRRVDNMMADGLAEEARALLPYRHLQALQTVGYTELLDHFNGLSSMEAAVEFIKRNTRQYAKRQVTWFKKDPEINWFSPAETEKIITLIETTISQGQGKLRS